jgi:hypothetical protein
MRSATLIMFVSLKSDYSLMFTFFVIPKLVLHQRCLIILFYFILSVTLNSNKNHSNLKFGIMLNNEAIVLESFV